MIGRLKIRSPHIISLLAVASLLIVSACSTKQNTAGSRFWQSFNSRFNTYFNGSQAYKEGCLAKETGNKDDYTEVIPLFTVGNKNSASLGKGNFETAVTKCEKAIKLHSIKKKPVRKSGKRLSAKEKSYQNRKEFNPFLKNAWLLMGKSQFLKGDFEEASATFSYIIRLYAAEPLVAQEARTWLARCYTELLWFYDAENMVNTFNRDSTTQRLRNDNDATTANLLLRQQHYDAALPYLQRTIKREKRKMQKARLYFLLGQVNTLLNKPQDAYKAYGKCIGQNPPYELAFNARIRQTEVLSNGSQGKKMISRLKRMARSSNNKEYLDQVYYALGNIYLIQKDTVQAVSAYEKGWKKATRNGIDKGLLLLRLGQVYWVQKKYDKAQKCYGEAAGIIDKTRSEYEEVQKRSKVLDELVPFTSAIQLQDSLQSLARMSEPDRNAAIDRAIAYYKYQEKLARQAKEDSAAQAANGGNNNTDNSSYRNGVPAASTSSTSNKAWYFYNTATVAQGKQNFEKIWGKRKLEDNWRRSNRSVLATDNSAAGIDYDKADSVEAAQAKADSVALAQENAPDSAQNDPHKREYYLKQIPLTEEQMKASNDILRDALYNAAMVEKDKLEDFPLADETFSRLCRDFPDFTPMDEVLYNRFQIYYRMKKLDKVAEMRELLSTKYPDSKLTAIVTDPDYERNARFGIEIEDSLYKATYDAYRKSDIEGVEQGYKISTRSFPLGVNRPKFIFLHALSRLITGERDSLAAELERLVKEYPESDVSEMAGMIVKGLRSGRVVGSGTYDIGSLWARRTADAEAQGAEANKQQQLSEERNTPFVYVLAYLKDSLNGDRLLYDLARYNFTGFRIRNFDIQRVEDHGISQFRISGFYSFAEVHTYAQALMNDSSIAAAVRKAHVLLISEENLKLIGNGYSYDDYQKFYEQHFAPIEIRPDLRLDQQEKPEQHYEEEMPTDNPADKKPKEPKKGEVDDGGEWY